MNDPATLELFDFLLSQWQAHKHLSVPPPAPIMLWSNRDCRIFIDSTWGPAIPYPFVDHQDGHQNHGYKPVKGDPKAISLIPEVKDWPELEQFLRTINPAFSPIESAGCDKAYFPATANDEPATMLGSYVDVIFTNAVLNDQAENHLLLAGHLAQVVKGCEQWWGNVEISLHRFRRVPGATRPWGILIRVTNGGRTEEEARKLWGETLRRLSNSIASLPRELQWTT